MAWLTKRHWDSVGRGMSRSARAVVFHVGAASAGLGATLVVSSCDPNVIAPLPSPEQPDDDRIITSSLTAVSDTSSDFLVAVVGFEGAVGKAATVELTNPRTGKVVEVLATASGGFSAAPYGRADDVIEVRQVDAQGARSEPLTLRVAAYEPPKAEATAGAEAGPPSAPAFQDDSREPDASGGTEAAKRLDVIWQYSDGVLRIDAAPGFTTPGDIVILADNDTGVVVAASADDVGAARLEVNAEVGDEMLLFNQDAGNSALTSPAVRFFVPEPGTEGGTDT